MAQRTLPGADPAPQEPSGRDTRSVWPSDSADGGIELAGAPGATEPPRPNPEPDAPAPTEPVDPAAPPAEPEDAEERKPGRTAALLRPRQA